jgi:hypothetical protein
MFTRVGAVKDCTNPEMKFNLEPIKPKIIEGSLHVRIVHGIGLYPSKSDTSYKTFCKVEFRNPVSVGEDEKTDIDKTKKIKGANPLWKLEHISKDIKLETSKKNDLIFRVIGVEKKSKEEVNLGEGSIPLKRLM